MSTIARPGFFGTSFHGFNLRANNIQRRSAPSIAILNSSSSSTRKETEFSEELQKVTIPQSEVVTQQNLQFDRLQPPDQVLIQENRIEFRQFVAREALLDEEYWTAAWLRAESHWEDRRDDRYADNYKRKFAEQEFNALKRRCRAVLGQKCTCIVAVKKEDGNVKRTVLKSVVGTLDLSIGVFSHGQTYPGEQVKLPLFFKIDRKGSSRFGYIANLCVAKSARRQGIASIMLQLAIKSAKENGTEQVFVHVHRDNRPAQKLYQKIGFKVVEESTFPVSDEQNLLLRLKA